MAHALQGDRAMRVMLCLVVLAGCHGHEKKWQQGRTYHMHAEGTFDGEIPKGWRDVHDLDGPPYMNVPRFEIELWPESFADGEILLGPIAPVSGDGCAGFVVGFDSAADTTKLFASDGQAATFDGDPGCRMRFAKDGKSGQLLIRSHGKDAVFVRCLGTMDGLADACEDVVNALKRVP